MAQSCCVEFEDDNGGMISSNPTRNLRYTFTSQPISTLPVKLLSNPHASTNTEQRAEHRNAEDREAEEGTHVSFNSKPCPHCFGTKNQKYSALVSSANTQPNILQTLPPSKPDRRGCECIPMSLLFISALSIFVIGLGCIAVTQLLIHKFTAN